MIVAFYFTICIVLAVWFGSKQTPVYLSDLLAILFWPFWILGACVVLLLAILNAKWGSYDL